MVAMLSHETAYQLQDELNIMPGRMAGSRFSFWDILSMVDRGTTDKLEDVLHTKSDVATCLRWYGWGLKFQHCIRKVLVDSELRENAAKRSYR